MNDSEIADLIAKLDDGHKPTVRAAVDALIPLAAKLPSVQEALNRRLHAGPKREWPVAYILAHLPRPSQRTIRTLLDALDHREADIRWAIALLLVRIAKDQPAMVNQLMDLCATGTANQKRMALYCIRDLTLSDANSLAALLGALLDLDPTVRVAAAISLKSRSDLDHAGRDALLQAYLKDTELRVRNAAAITLAHLGETSAEFLSALQQAVDGEDEQARKTAATALALIKKIRSSGK